MQRTVAAALAAELHLEHPYARHIGLTMGPYVKYHRKLNLVLIGTPESSHSP